MQALKLRALRFEQKGRVFYATVVPAGELIHRAKVDVWNADDPPDEAGYQRAPSPSRLREVASYVERDDGILPTGGLLNARAQNGSAYGAVLEFEPDKGEDGGIQSGWLSIAPETIPLWIVDMQHRLLGLEVAVDVDGRTDLADFPLVTTIADGLEKLEEVEQFDVINTTQKKVRTDLARRTMAIRSKDPERRLEFDRRGRLWEARGPMVVDWLNRHSAIWKGRILPPNKSKREMSRSIVRETSFVTSLKPIMQTPLFVRMSEEQVAIVIDRFWLAIREIFQDAFEFPEDYVIQKTPGVFSLHALVPEIVEVIRSRGAQVTVEEVVQIIQPWTEMGIQFWARDQVESGAARYGSMKGFARLAAELRTKLPQLDLDELGRELV